MEKTKQKSLPEFSSIDKYIRSFPKSTQTILKKMRGIIIAAAPEAEEKISYRMPTFY
ncbi:MAG TPA: hypothetical protein VF335_07665 [Chitinivibrionales bacterium]